MHINTIDNKIAEIIDLSNFPQSYIFNYISKHSENKINYYWLGRCEYISVWDLQKKIQEKVKCDNLNDIILFLEHDPVYTIGKNADYSNLLPTKPSDIKIIKTDRGGDITCHAPGQLVGYPIINLKQYSMGPLKYVEILQETLIEVLSYFDINSNKSKNPAGVWVNNEKIAAIGLKISKNTTMHGLALNINPDLSYFEYIVPCGNANLKPTSIKNLLKKYPEKKILIKLFVQIFLNKLNKYDKSKQIQTIDNNKIIKIECELSNIIQKKLEVEHIFNSNSYITSR